MGNGGFNRWAPIAPLLPYFLPGREQEEVIDFVVESGDTALNPFPWLRDPDGPTGKESRGGWPYFDSEGKPHLKRIHPLRLLYNKWKSALAKAQGSKDVTELSDEPDVDPGAAAVEYAVAYFHEEEERKLQEARRERFIQQRNFARIQRLQVAAARHRERRARRDRRRNYRRFRFLLRLIQRLLRRYRNRRFSSGGKMAFRRRKRRFGRARRRTRSRSRFRGRKRFRGRSRRRAGTRRFKRRRSNWSSSRKVVPRPEVKVRSFYVNDFAPLVAASSYVERCWPLLLDDGGFMSSVYFWKRWYPATNQAAGTDFAVGTDSDKFVGDKIYVKMFIMQWRLSAQLLADSNNYACPIVCRLWRDEWGARRDATTWGARASTTVSAQPDQNPTGRYPVASSVYVDPCHPKSLRLTNLAGIDTDAERQNSLGWKCVRTWTMKTTQSRPATAGTWARSSQDPAMTFKMKFKQVRFDRTATIANGQARLQANKKYYITFSYETGGNPNLDGTVPLLYNVFGRVYYTDV